MASARFQQFMERHRTRITTIGSFPRSDRSSQSGQATTPTSSFYSVSTSGQQQQQQQQQQHTNGDTSDYRSLNSTSINGEQRKCWICFGNDEQADIDATTLLSPRSDSTIHDRWVKACSCSLISHESCLLRWITENQKDMPFKKVHCPQCKAVYQLVESRSILLAIMSRCDTVIRSTIPYICGIGLGCCLLVTCTTFGTYAVLTLCGTEYGERLLGGPNPWGWRVWIGLPMIPIALIFSRTTYLDAVLPILPLSIMGGPQFQPLWPPTPAVTTVLLPWIRMAYNGVYQWIFGSMERQWDLQLSPQYQTPFMEDTATGTATGTGTTETGINLTNTSPNTEGVHQNEPTPIPRQQAQIEDDLVDDLVFIDVMHDVMRTVIGALLFPAIASFCGSMLGRISLVRSTVRDPFNRSILGGCLFVVAKDVIQLLYKRQRLKQRRSRRIRDVSEMQEQTAVKL